MPVYSNDVADKVLRVLQSANRLDQQKLADARALAQVRVPMSWRG